MRRLLPTLLLAAGASGALAAYAVLYYNHWYYAGVWWPRWLLLALLLTPVYLLLLQTPWRGLWRSLACYWVALLGLFALAGDFDLARSSFVGVLNLEVPMVWVPSAWIAIYLMRQPRPAWRAELAAQQRQARSLELRRRLRRRSQRPQPAHAAAAQVIDFPLEHQPLEEDEMAHDTAPHLLHHPALEMQELHGDDPAQPGDPAAPDANRYKLLGLLLPLALCLAALLPQAGQAEGVDSTEPWVRPDRHTELKDESLRRDQSAPPLPGDYPAPLHAREKETFYIVISNKADGTVGILDKHGRWRTLGKVLSPVRKVNPAGFTASGWGAPGTLIATAVNALHIKTKHDYATGRSTVFSLLPVEFAEFDPASYLSYFNATASLVTDIPAGSGIFGGQWAPLIGSRVYVAPAGWTWVDVASSGPAAGTPLGTTALGEDYAPAEGDSFVIAVERHKYNPEWIEFENRFGGIIWVKELGLDAYPVGQVLKPVAGAGRFQGSLYAPPGRIRANHPGVICISTSPDGAVGGFQIIPRDHSMSGEMTAARTKTQWMVVGPLWAFDPSWEGTPPLFTDYLYPAYVPLSGKLKDGTEVSGADVFLDRFTVRARYADAADPTQYELLRPTAPLTFEALKDMTHLRIYFPRE